MRRMRAGRGFTLLELVVVIGLIGLVGTLGIRFFNEISAAWNSARVRTQLDERAEYAFSQIQQDLNHAVTSSLAAVPFKGTSKEVRLTSGYFAAPQVGDDEMSLAVLVPAQGKLFSREITYYVNRENGKRKDELRRGQADFNGGTPAWTLVAPGVAAFDLSFEGQDGQWQRNWSKATLPAAVRVSLTLYDTDEGLTSPNQVTRVAVFPLHVS